MDDPWDQEDEHRRADFEHMLERMQQDHADRTIESAEASLSSIVATVVPMPDTAHPALEQYAEVVRSAKIDPIRISVPRAIAASRVDPGELYPTAEIGLSFLTLTYRKCAGPAPFVGDPQWRTAVYIWRVWTDDYGRHVGGSAQMVWRHTTP